MDSSEFIADLRKELAEIGKILAWAEKSEEIHQIDIDLLLKKTRHLYGLLLDYPDGGRAKNLAPVPETAKTPQQKPEPVPEPKPEPVLPKEPVKEFKPQPVPEPVPAPKFEPFNEPEFLQDKEADDVPVWEPEPEPFVEEFAEPEPDEEMEPEWEPFIEPEPMVRQAPQPQPMSIFPSYDTPAPKQNKHQVKETQSGASLFQRDNSLNEVIRRQKSGKDSAKPLNDIPITDIWSAITINERFLFIRELFGNDPEGFKNTVTLLNSLSSYEAAKKFMLDRFSWDPNNPVANDFLNVVKRRFL